MQTFWHYTFKTKNDSYGFGIQKTNKKDFDFIKYYTENKTDVIMSLTKISEETFKELSIYIDSINNQNYSNSVKKF